MSMRAIYDFEQRSKEWHEIRWGRLTGTEFRVLMHGTRAARDKLAADKRFQLANPCPADIAEINARSLDWGRDNEPRAAARYELARFDLLFPAFIIHPKYDFIGVSPDGINDLGRGVSDRGVEIKCPHNQAIHSSTWNLGMPVDHYPQVQGGMFVTDFGLWDFISFDPRLPAPKDFYLQTIQRDGDYISRLERRCLDLWDLVNSDREIGCDLAEIPSLF